MKRSIVQGTLLVAGVALLLLAWAPGLTPTAAARPLAALTPTAEPPTRTPTIGPTSTPPNTPSPTLPPRPTTPPTDTPAPQPTQRPSADPADPAITKEVSPGEARIGDIVDFTLTVTNHGDETADDVAVTDVLPAFLDVLDANTSKGTVAISGRTVAITIGSVAPGEVVIIHIRAQVNAQALPPGGRNSVTLTSSNNSDDPRNNTDSVTIGIVGDGLSPSATPTASPPAGKLPTAPPEVAVGAASGGQPRPPHLPLTGAGDARSEASWPLAIIGLGLIGLSLALRRRSARTV